MPQKEAEVSRRLSARHNDKDHEHIHVAINKIHPESFRMHSPAWDHQKLFTAGRALEAELGLTPLQLRTRERDDLPQRAADYEAQQGVESFARWARDHLRPALRATELHSWDDVHRTCARFGVVLRAHGNGLVFEDWERRTRVKASSVGREFSKSRLCERFGNFESVSADHLKACRRAPHRYAPRPHKVPESLWVEYAQCLVQARLHRQNAWSDYRKRATAERQRLKEKYRNQRRFVAALPVSGPDRKRLFKQLAQRRTIDSWLLRRKLAKQRRLIQKTPHPGTWRHFVARCAARGDARAIRVVRRPERERSGWDLGRGE